MDNKIISDVLADDESDALDTTSMSYGVEYAEDRIENPKANGTGDDNSDSENQPSLSEQSVGDADVAASEESGTRATFEGDLAALVSEFPELSARLSDGFVNTERYSKLRSLGLTPTEAYLATARTHTKNNRSHLTSSVPAGAKSPSCGMSKREMETAKYLFGDLSEREIVALYNKVTK
ncbi:MAG: hypothetical protein J6Q85_03355 [Clostridia bacterium]|nr:hypothetical protein [Clostridia bacterium]